MADLKDTLKNNVEHGANAVKQGVDKVSGAGQYAKDAAMDATSTVANYATQAKDAVIDLAHNAGVSTEHAAQKAQVWAEDAYKATSDTVSDFGKEVTDLIRKHPLPAVLIGLGLGMLLGRAAKV